MSSYIDHTDPATRGVGTNWRDFTHKRLCWLYGLDRAWAIHKGNDTATNRDVEAWRLLGRRRVA